jgi:hypothetical protein
MSLVVVILTAVSQGVGVGGRVHNTYRSCTTPWSIDLKRDAL